MTETNKDLYCECSSDGRDIFISTDYKYVCLDCGKLIKENNTEIHNNRFAIPSGRSFGLFPGYS